MNAHTPIHSDALTGKATPPITVRDRRFGRGQEAARWWLDGDPIATAWFNALSATFPRGEALFIESVKAFRDGAPPKLEAEIRAFIRQEINHTREHVAFNKAAVQAGYDMSRIDERVAALIAQVKDRPPIGWLAVTMALEHFTAMFAHEFLKHPQHFVGADVEQAELWRWHAAEEIEHKGVAYDVWLHATRGWSRWKRWKVKSMTMLLVTSNFVRHRFEDALDLLRQDGIAGWKAKARLIWYLVGKPGIMRRVAPAWLAYFLPGFHPWEIDDRALISRYDSEFPDAVPAPA
ncbi:metal-dependent hydrolase [Altericroceibacterium xinjiangense]|uniref:metal-dependent hydrolase n=1 Tax=Altericroceibacterium xinjiangense TaxID=762261 RepID=UPI000F7F099C|nr:metal-dependent hydrolase [Altericroceibacterium xinjiangense]